MALPAKDHCQSTMPLSSLPINASLIMLVNTFQWSMPQSSWVVISDNFIIYLQKPWLSVLHDNVDDVLSHKSARDFVLTKGGVTHL